MENIGSIGTNWKFAPAKATLGTLGGKVEAMKDAGKLSNESFGILQFIKDVYEKTASTIVNAVCNRNNEMTC
jgi:hypothetical protein